jgi:hypothetical protein
VAPYQVLSHSTTIPNDCLSPRHWDLLSQDSLSYYCSWFLSFQNSSVSNHTWWQTSIASKRCLLEPENYVSYRLSALFLHWSSGTGSCFRESRATDYQALYCLSSRLFKFLLGSWITLHDLLPSRIIAMYPKIPWAANVCCFQVPSVTQSHTLLAAYPQSQPAATKTWALFQGLALCEVILRYWALLSPCRVGPLNTAPFTFQTPGSCLNFSTHPCQILSLRDHLLWLCLFQAQ